MSQPSTRSRGSIFYAWVRLGVAVSALASVVLVWVYSQGQAPQVGYAVLSVGAGSTAPVGTTLFSFTNSAGVLVWEAGVGAVEPVRSGRIFVERSQRTRTAIALANPSGQAATATLIVRDSQGNEVGRSNEAFGVGQHRARFLEELPIALPPTFTSGSLTFESDQRLAAITLRENQNVYQEAIYATLPVVDLGAPASTQSIVFPHIAVGDGYYTQLVLINRSAERTRGRIRLIRSDGTPLQLSFGSEIPYDIAPNGTYRTELSSPLAVQVGYAVVTLEQGTTIPAGSAIFQTRRNDRVVTEAGVAAIAPTTSARIFIDRAKTETGVAIASAGNPATPVTFELLDRNGGAIAIKTESLPAGGHLARFASELFPGLPEGFTGLMEISCSLPIVPITLKLTNNQRADTILTTLPVADLTRPPTATSLIFPHLAFGSGYSTRQILINTSKTQPASGTVRFFQSSGGSLNVPLGGQTASQFAYQVNPGSGRQMRPGNTATPQQISIDPFNPGATEVAVNEGNALQLSPTVLDSQGSVRDDFPVSYQSLSTDIATVDANGKVQAKRAGFSTLAVSAGAIAVTTSTITVAKVTSGVGFLLQITDLEQDGAGRFYMANTVDHTILLAQDITRNPERYAGVHQSEGLQNDVRLNSRFKKPAFLAYDRSEGSLYVSDGANHVVRQVRSGPGGRVETLAGTAQIGSQDGPNNQARFNNPQGIALDNRGNLWVVDSGNHTVRRINLVTKTVQTIAGAAGASGLVDGTGSQARFNAPVGIAIETESLSRQLESRTGEAAPPVSMIVADSANGRIRRVREDGQVQTVGSISDDAAVLAKSHLRKYQASATPRFSFPEGVAVDPFGNIYVTEPEVGRVKTILQNGQIVAAVQTNTFRSPKGISIAESGRLVVADSNRAGAEIAYGRPVISSIAPDRISSRGGTTVTIKGKNFAPSTLLVVGGIVISSVQLLDTETVTFVAPALRSGLATLTLQNRGGLVQKPFFVDAVPLSELSPGQITTVVGGSTFVGDGSEATLARVRPTQIAIDGMGNLFIADPEDNRIRKVDAVSKVITTVAGTGQRGYSGDDGPAIAADLWNPSGIVVDVAGNLFIADIYNHRIRKVDAATKIITTVAGTGGTGQFPGFSGDGGPATAAVLPFPSGIAVDAASNLFVTDFYNSRIRKVDAVSKIITTVAGNGKSDFSGDGGPATAAAFFPSGIAVDVSGNLFIADARNYRIRKVDAVTQIITTVAGTGNEGFSGDGGPATAAALSPSEIALDAASNLFMVDFYNDRIRKVDAVSKIITTVAGNGQESFSGDGGPATAAALHYPSGVAVDAAGNVFIGDSRNYRVRKVDAVSKIITTVAGSGQFGLAGDGGPATAAALSFPVGVAVGAAGNVFVADSGRIRMVDPVSKIITTVAGNGQLEHSGIAVDDAGNLFIAGDNRIRKVDAVTKTISTVVGTGLPGFSGDGGLATAAALNLPSGVAVDAAGNVYIADTENARIRKVDAISKIISTVAGKNLRGFSGEGVPATDASLFDPKAVAVDGSGNVFIGEHFGRRVRKVDAVTKLITTVAGTGQRGFSGDGGPATAAVLTEPAGIAVDVAGNLFIADTGNRRIRKVDAVNKIITTVAGTGQSRFSGDNGPAAAAALSPAYLIYPFGVAVDGAGNLFIADTSNRRIRAVRGPIK